MAKIKPKARVIYFPLVLRSRPVVADPSSRGGGGGGGISQRSDRRYAKSHAPRALCARSGRRDDDGCGTGGIAHQSDDCCLVVCLLSSTRRTDGATVFGRSTEPCRRGDNISPFSICGLR